MTKHCEGVYEELPEIAMYAFLLIGLALSSAMCLVMGLTAGPGESLIDLLFWPSVAAISFSIGMIIYLTTDPFRWHITLTFPPLDTDPDDLCQCGKAAHRKK